MRGWDIIGTIYEHTQNDKSHKTYTNNVTRVKLTCLETGEYLAPDNFSIGS